MNMVLAVAMAALSGVRIDAVELLEDNAVEVSFSHGSRQKVLASLLVAKTEYVPGKYVFSPMNPIVPLGPSGAWDNYAVHGSAAIAEGGIWYVLYGGRAPTAGTNNAKEIGLAFGESPESLTKYFGNPVVSRASLGLSGIDEGITPFDVKNFGGVYYLYCTVTDDSTPSFFDVGVISSSDLIHWSALTPIITHNWASHGPQVVVDPFDANKLTLYYSAAATDIHPFSIKAAYGTVKDPMSFTPDDTHVFFIRGDPAIYPNVDFFNDALRLFYSSNAFTDRGEYRIYEGHGLSSQKFVGGAHTIGVAPFGFGSQYVTTSRLVIDGDTEWHFFSGRNKSDGKQDYVGIGVASRALNPGATESVVNSDIFEDGDARVLNTPPLKSGVYTFTVRAKSRNSRTFTDRAEVVIP